jgi:hypothetical protein
MTCTDDESQNVVAVALPYKQLLYKVGMNQCNQARWVIVYIRSNYADLIHLSAS